MAPEIKITPKLPYYAVIFSSQLSAVAKYCGVSITVIEKTYLHNRAEFIEIVAKHSEARSREFWDSINVV